MDRLLFLEGSASGLTALAAFWFLPDRPERTRWLTERERTLARERMERDKLADAGDTGTVWSGLLQAVKDPRLWLFCLIQNFHYAGLSFINFLPT